MKYDVSFDNQTAALSINEQHFRYERDSGEAVENDYHIEPAGDATYTVLLGQRSFRAILLSNNAVIINGHIFELEIFDPREMRGRKKADHAAGKQKVAAPMPGRVVRLLVNIGQHVETGQGLIVVEAMKMQNEMKSPRNGRVSEIRASDGAAVAAGEVLIVIE